VILAGSCLARHVLQPQSYVEAKVEHSMCELDCCLLWMKGGVLCW
jgi:hypothetical protein